MSASVQPPGLTTLASTMPHGIDSAILSNHNQCIWGDILLLQVGVFLGYILHHTRGKAVKVIQVVSLLLWQVREKSSRRFDQLESGLVPRCLCRCLWFVRPQMWGKDDPFHGNSLQRFPGLKLLFHPLSNFAETGLELGSFLGHLCLHKGIAKSSTTVSLTSP